MDQYEQEKAFLEAEGENNNDFVFLKELPELLKKYYHFKINNQRNDDIEKVALAILENQFDIAGWNVSEGLKKAALISIVEFSEWYKTYLIEQEKKDKLTFYECRQKIIDSKGWTSEVEFSGTRLEFIKICDEAAEMYAQQFILIIPTMCEHKNITSSDGLDECQDCGARNY